MKAVDSLYLACLSKDLDLNIFETLIIKRIKTKQLLLFKSRFVKVILLVPELHSSGNFSNASVKQRPSSK